MSPSDEVTTRSEAAPRYPYADDGVLYPESDEVAIRSFAAPEEEMLDEDWDDVYNDRFYDSLGG